MNKLDNYSVECFVLYHIIGGGVMEEKNNLEIILSEVLADFFNTYEIKPYPINIIITSNLVEEYFRLRPDFVGKMDGEEQVKNFNGLMVAPIEFEGQFTILLNAQYVCKQVQDGKFDFVGTLVHEATHINDFMQYSKIIEIQDYNFILDRSKNRLFHYWTEYNAKKRGYYFLRKYIFSNNMKDRQAYSYIMKTELPFHIDYLVEKFNSTDSIDEQMYCTVHFLGRLSVWQDLFPNDFTDKVMKQIFGSNMWVYDLYKFFRRYPELKDIYAHFDEMKRIIQQNYPYFD